MIGDKIDFFRDKRDLMTEYPFGAKEIRVSKDGFFGFIRLYAASRHQYGFTRLYVLKPGVLEKRHKKISDEIFELAISADIDFFIGLDLEHEAKQTFEPWSDELRDKAEMRFNAQSSENSQIENILSSLGF